MNTVNNHDAEAHLPRITEYAAAGEPPAAGEARRLGFLGAHILVPDDFDRMGSAEIEELFCVR
jgi:hypothetical protein